MNKLKLEKIKLQDLSPEQQKNINGGKQITTWTIIPVTIGILTETISEASRTMCNVSCDNCVSNNPGTQNSCGLCQSKQYTNCH